MPIKKERDLITLTYRYREAPPQTRAKPRRVGALAGVFWKGRCKIRGFELDPL